MKVESGNGIYDSRDNCNAIIKTGSNILIAGCKNTKISNSVTSIGKSAFASCSSLTSITIPNSVTSIEYHAFYGCSGLTSVTIPNSVTFIADYAFQNCSGLNTIVSEVINPSAINDYVFNCSDKDIYATAILIVPSGSKSIYQSTNGWKKFANIVEAGEGGIIGQIIKVDGIKYKIGENNTMSVTRSVAGLSAPNDNYLGDIVIHDHIDYNGIKYTVTSIEADAFGLFFGPIVSLTSITIPNTITSIGGEAFGDQSSLTAVYITDLEAWCNIKFNGSGSNPLNFAHHLFLNGNEIKDVIIPNSVKSLGTFVFEGGSGFSSITIPTSVTSIGVFAFKGCTGLTSVTIPNSVTSIGSSAFLGCSSLSSVTIPNSVTSIGNYAFSGCNGLTSVTIPNSVTSIGNTAFNGTGWYNNQSNGFLYLENWLLGYKGNKPTGDMTIIEGTKGIASSAFYSCSGLTSVTIPNSVSSIGDNAFSSCSGLTSIYSLSRIPSSCGSNTFSYVDKTNCVVWVPKGSLAAYKNADVWKDFTSIRELAIGDVNIDFEVNKEDLNATTNHIMGKAPENFYESLADLNCDEKVNAADVVKLVDILNVQNGLSNDWQLSFNSSQVVSSLSCTLNNNGSKAVQLTKCKLYNNQSIVGYATFNVTLASGGSKTCSFDNLNYAAKTGFYVIWHYTYNGEEYTYRFDLTE